MVRRSSCTMVVRTREPQTLARLTATVTVSPAHSAEAREAPARIATATGRLNARARTTSMRSRRVLSLIDRASSVAGGARPRGRRGRARGAGLRPRSQLNLIIPARCRAGTCGADEPRQVAGATLGDRRRTDDAETAGAR